MCHTGVSVIKVCTVRIHVHKYIHAYLSTCSVCLLTTGSTEGTVDEDKQHFPIPSYMNVELDDGSVPMTTNPSYGQVERQHDHHRPVYGNL